VCNPNQVLDENRFDPAKNPAILDTATPDRRRAFGEVEQAAVAWEAAIPAALEGRLPSQVDRITLYRGSWVQRGTSTFFLAGLPDGQQVVIQIDAGDGQEILGEPLGQITLKNDVRLAVYPSDAKIIDRFCRVLQPCNRPRALGATPRLGLGSRMTTAVWPGMFQTMSRRGFAANPIQNSVRELNLLDDVLAGRPSPRNYACGFGTIETGYTGSTYEGLWVSGVLAALQYEDGLRYGADADHLQVKRGTAGMDYARQLVEATRYYTFYTLDVSDILDYRLLQETAPGAVETCLREKIPQERARQDFLAYHTREYRLGQHVFGPDALTVSRLAGKYWDALEALAALSDDIGRLKKGEPFDLEFTIDEHPPEIDAFDCLSTEAEIVFVLREIQRRDLPVTHLAPNFGVEKGWDYRGTDGLAGLEQRVRAIFQIAEAFGVLVDFHSADDLTADTRRVLRKATGGRLHYKISPMLQLLFAEVLQAYHPDLFRRWWDDAMAYARREAEAGSDFARECLQAYAASAEQSPRRQHPVFHHYSFAFVGRRDANGQFLHREEFYSLSPEFYRAYQQRVADYVGSLADELL
jgi:hypothetical protein